MHEEHEAYQYLRETNAFKRETGGAKMESVDIIAAGYEWICPECERFHRMIETKETVTCEECKTEFEVGGIHHAIG